MTKSDVFIIESLTLKDEKKDRFEGDFLSQILRLGGKKPIYYYIRTKKELKRMLREFGRSNYRYLHLSCHGNRASLSTTLGDISFSELKKLLQPYLRDKRLFISTCLAVNDNLARAVIPSSGCFSIVGPDKKVAFNDAAIVYASLYHLMFKADRKKMTRKGLLPALQKVADTFRVPLNYFSISRKSEKGYKFTPIRSESKKST